MKKIFLVFACFGVILLRAQSPSVSNQDREFTEKALMANLMETKLSEMALNKGFSPQVKELAQHMLDNHKKSDDLLRQMATAKSIPTATQLDEEHQKDYNKLADKEGEAFDMAYTECMIKDHKEIINMYEKEKDKGENTELKAFATNSLPSLNHHKNLADETCKKLKKK